MKRLRFRILVLTCWLVFFYSLERLLPPLQVSGLVYTLALMLVIALIFFRQLARLPLWLVATLPACGFRPVFDSIYRRSRQPGYPATPDRNLPARNNHSTGLLGEQIGQ